METVYDIATRAADKLCPPVPGKRRDREYEGYQAAYEAFEAVAVAHVTSSSQKGPNIERLLHILPLTHIRENVGSGEDVHLVHMEPVDPYRTAFTWDPKPTTPATDIRPFETIKTLHRYAYYGFFKPSIAEVLSQIPAELQDRTVAFTTSGPSNADDLNDEPLALDAGFHVAETTLYERAPADT